MIESINKVIQNFSKDPVLEKRNKPGLCRVWTDRVLDLVEGMEEDKQELSAEAREVQVEPGLFHTFIILRMGNKSYLWDGIGTGKHVPYFGPEEQAPEHLKNSRSDIINIIRNYY